LLYFTRINKEYQKNIKNKKYNKKKTPLQLSDRRCVEYIYKTIKTRLLGGVSQPNIRSEANAALE